MDNEKKYQVQVGWNANRNGTLSSEVLDEKLRVATPPEFPNGEANIWSPEHYFLAAINGCLLTTFLAIAENFKLDFVDFSSNAEGKLDIVDKKYVVSEVILKPIVSVKNNSDKELALKVLEKAEKACLISNSVNSKITMHPTIKF